MLTIAAINLSNLVTMAAAFLLVLLVWLGAMLIWHMHQRGKDRQLAQRLGLGGEKDKMRTLRLWHEGHEAVTVVAAPQRVPLLTRIVQAHKVTGISVPVQTVLLAVVGLSALSFVIVYAAVGRLLAAAASLVVFPLAGWIYTGYRARQYSAMFERQLVDALEIASRSLRAGHPLVGAFRLVSEEIAAPLGEVFGEICQQQQLGVPLEKALADAAARSGNADMRLFATSVSIQLRTGGNLADMMERLCDVIRDRMRLSRRVRVLTAQTQMSKRILLALPLLLFAMLNLLKPGYMEPLYTTRTGQIALVATGALVLFGAWIMNRMSILRY